MLYLSKNYYLVVGDRFELFYRSVIKHYNPYVYYIKATCEKGYTYNRYYTYTPKEDEVGSYSLIISIYDNNGNVIEEQETTLIVNPIPHLTKQKTILCIGDSLTVNGVWPKIGYEKLNETNPNMLNFIGKMSNNIVRYEGYGGWQWKTFCENNQKSQTSSVWIETSHNLDDTYQHTNWTSGEINWVLETIEKNRLKFKRGINNNKVNPIINNQIICKEYDIKLDVINYSYSEGNPFYNTDTNTINFKKYIEDNKFEEVDYVFILLTWNGQYKPYNEDFSLHDKYSSIFIDNIHKSFPKAKIGILGIQPPCPNGGITACYGASGYYHNWYGEVVTELNYNKFLEEKCYREEYKSFLKYFDTKAQFDSEYNYYVKDMKVNNRSQITERIGVNGIHPSMDGYNQIGDSFYRALVEMLLNDN